MRILILSPFVPYPPLDGGRIRVLELSKQLAEGHDVEILALASGRDDIEGARFLDGDGISVQTVPHDTHRIRAGVRALRNRSSLYLAMFSSRSFTKALTEKLARSWDIVQCEYPYTAQYRDVASTSRRTRGPLWVLDAHNVEYALAQSLLDLDRKPSLYRAYARRELELRRREELAICRRMNHLLTVSETDRRLLASAAPDVPTTVIPNGVDPDRFRSRVDPASRTRQGAVFVGKMDYRPNVDAMGWFVGSILPVIKRAVPEFTFTIVGRSPTSTVRRLTAHAGVRVVGDVEDVRPFLDGASAAVIPLRAGTGTRLKLLEALAMECPVVTTTVGCTGIALEHGRSALVADTEEAFASAVLQLLGNPGDRTRLAQEGRNLVESRYRWKSIGARLNALYAELSMGNVATVSQ
jgi:glycosyltransferase involved in cell wall biosynthesis